jgi:hypothetical protein
MKESLRQVSPGEAEKLIKLSIYDDKVCQKSIAYTLTDVPLGTFPESLYGSPWQEVTYYGDKQSVDRSLKISIVSRKG